MKVKTIRAHRNVWGESYDKAEGDTYDLPDDQAAALVDTGDVELVE
ncbi:MAG: hypothetical protein RIS94_3276 [Pseudomonadota bacterium]|jgi:hypothetical protein